MEIQRQGDLFVIERLMLDLRQCTEGVYFLCKDEVHIRFINLVIYEYYIIFGMPW